MIRLHFLLLSEGGSIKLRSTASELVHTATMSQYEENSKVSAARQCCGRMVSVDGVIVEGPTLRDRSDFMPRSHQSSSDIHFFHRVVENGRFASPVAF